MSTVGGQGMRRPSAMGGVCTVFRPGAAAHGWRERMVARARNGRRCTVRALCNSRVFDQALSRVRAGNPFVLLMLLTT